MPDEEAEKAVAVAEQAAAQAKVLAETLSSTLEMVSDRLASLQRSKASKRTAFMLAVSVGFDIALSVVMIIFAFAISSAQNDTKSVNITQCVSNNSDRSEDAVLWNTLLSDFDKPGTKVTPQNAAAIKEINSLRAIVTVKDAQRNCAKIYG